MLNLKILRLTAWLLLVATLVTLLSGFYALKPFLAPWLSQELVRQIHYGFVLLIFILLFYLHSLTGIFNLLNRHPKLHALVYKIVIAIIWTAILLLLLYFFVAQTPTSYKPLSNNSNQVINSASTTDTANLTAQIVASHNNAASCWMIINNKVYDLTNYLNIHPGNAYAILPYCGQDGSRAYDTKDRNQSHSSYANQLLQQYYLGDLQK